MANGKVIKFGESAQEKIIEGVELAANAIARTLGPAGRGVSLGLDFGAPEITRDGASVAKFITFLDPMLNQGAQLVKKAASLTEDSAGDGTSSSSILTKELCKKGQRAIKTGANVNEIKSGMLKAQKWMTQYIAQNATKVDGDLELIRKVATISANNDEEIGNLIAEAVEKVGHEGIITIEEAKGTETYIQVNEGIQFNTGFLSPYFITDRDKSTCVLESPRVLLYDSKMSTLSEFYEVLEQVMTRKESILVVASDYESEVLDTLILNKIKAGFKICVVKTPRLNRSELMEDIAAVTGATILNDTFEKYQKRRCFGIARIRIFGFVHRASRSPYLRLG